MIAINHHPSRTQLLWFSALWLPLSGAAAGGMLLWRAQPSAAYAVWMAMVVATALSLVSTTVARGVFIGLSYITYPAGFVISWAALAAIYYLVLTPTALVMRLAGRDVLRLKPRAATETQWIERPRRGGEARHAFRQF